VKPREVLRRARAPAIVVVVYLVLRAVFDRLTEQGGLVSPDGSVSAGVVVVGAIVIVLRIVVLFVLPAVAAYRAVQWLLGAGGGPRAGRG
jgi:hypothetical protein